MNSLKCVVLLLVILTAGVVGDLKSQPPCMVNAADTVVGMHPSDTLPDFFFNGTVVTHVVQFVADADTTVFGFPLAYDSALTSSYLWLPQGMQVHCQSSPAPCMTYPDFGANRIRFCYAVSMGPSFTTNASYPDHDSIGIVCDYYMQIPVVGTYILRDTMALYYRSIYWYDSFGHGLPTPAEIEAMITPNPATTETYLRMQVTGAGLVGWALHDVLGREVIAEQLGMPAVGPQTFPIPTGRLPEGIYFLTVSEGMASKTLRLLHRE